MSTQMITVQTWGRFGSHERLGTIRVRVTYDTPFEAPAMVAASIARRLGLSICGGPRGEGTALDRRGAPESYHYAVTLGRPCRGGGCTVEAEVWYAIPHRKDPAAVALGRRGGAAGKGSPARRAAALAANAASPKSGRPRGPQHLPDPDRASGPRGYALCGQYARYRTADHDLLRRQALEAGDGDTARYCQDCLQQLRLR